MGRLVWEPQTVERVNTVHERGHDFFLKPLPVNKTDEQPALSPSWQSWQSAWTTDFAHKVSLADRIEGCPNNYLRGVVAIPKRSTMDRPVLAFLYYKDTRSHPQTADDTDGSQWKKYWIRSGNFLRRGAAFEGIPPF